MSTRRSAIVNYLLYQAGWFACVLGAAKGHPWAGSILALALVGAHVAFAEHRRDEWRLALGATALGIGVDTLQIQLGTLHFSAGVVHPALPPVWLPLMWAQFATTLNYSLSWLRGSRLRAALFGALGGPLAFFAGQRLGAVQFAQPLWFTLLMLSVLWGISVPVIVHWAGRQGEGAGVGRYR